MATRQDLINATAGVLDVDPTKLNLSTPLIDQGLDSLRLIALIEELRAQDIEVDFFEVSSLPALEQWFLALGLED
ncbi:MAG: phosphopantetheine-binding protein [Corynebacterium sp.]|nr:phosphopantetheine-binding protein [Corynebacterium sp.]